MVFYASSPESGSDGESTANLENDTEKKRAKEGTVRGIVRRSAKIPKSFTSKDVKGLNGRV